MPSAIFLQGCGGGKHTSEPLMVVLGWNLFLEFESPNGQMGLGVGFRWVGHTAFPSVVLQGRGDPGGQGPGNSKSFVQRAAAVLLVHSGFRFYFSLDRYSPLPPRYDSTHSLIFRFRPLNSPGSAPRPSGAPPAQTSLYRASAPPPSLATSRL